MSIFKKKDEKKMLTDKVIRAADFLLEPKDDSDPESYELSQSDKILFGLFGDSPDYSKWKYERLWKKFHRADDEDTIAYCLKKGVDVIGNDGEPVPGWRDIAVMLKSIENGYLKLAKGVGV